MTIREVAHGSAEYWSTIELRMRVLRRPLGLDFTEAELSAESDEFHLAAFDQELIGCLVLVPKESGEIKMRQVAVEPRLQKAGVGTALVLASEELARERGYALITLHARDLAVPFYLRLGYEIEGDPFEEVTIPHVKMIKRLL
ncbi:MAG TPA: GNAT family N-acetyltransferase [Fimbriimonas sp.]|nr:GNAT family N-acetyltransferase [Fimbriimonas sp.]